MRLLADESVEAPVCRLLRQEGHDVIAIMEESPGAQDDVVLSRATRERRVLVTNDKDFAELGVRREPAPPSRPTPVSTAAAMSLKLTVGMVRGRYMVDLHAPLRPRGEMIAEISRGLRPALVLMDGMEAFVDGGPGKGTRKRPGVFVAGDDPVAVDAVGLAILKSLGTTRDIQDAPIFSQPQIRRAGELGLGVRSPAEIELVAVGEQAERVARLARAQLRAG